MEKASANFLRGKIVMSGKTMEEFAKSVSIRPETLRKKMGVGGEFKLGELKRIKTALSLTPAEVDAIFFS